ncbi:histidine kinase dimerization/phosphoacceptor domain -containing protein [Oceanibaculum pacificum]|uniref:Signal transduction histidine kinase subgroup 2 dimerisation and phosphoacceptor domain-containing protein n=1 Tax=Oceanibaculum pacificum TaxID=580166 RepID=A0A154VYD5_9PROT|nr:histidine kinase dimerization/phosphoacceptor domain -containing protein [Oceanibaculum pacificum]KZD06344.1 hypothetical protein AUP43_10895 [Oceanibaculum pacificum]
MGRTIVDRDWSDTPLGPIQEWPVSLRTAVTIILSSHQPMALWWGQSLTQLHNDAYAKFLGDEGERLGAPLRAAIPEGWSAIADDIEAVSTSGSPRRHARIELPSPTDREKLEHYFTISLDPLFDRAANPHGALAVFCDDTAGVVRERRLNILNDLANNIRIAKDAPAVCQMAVKSIVKEQADVHFALVYSFDYLVRRARLIAASGPAAETAPAEIELDAARDWPIDRAANGEASLLLDPRSLPEYDFHPAGHSQAGALGTISVLPLDATHAGRPHGALLVGALKSIRTDEGYREFLAVIADQLAAGIEARFQVTERTNAIGAVRHRMRNNLQLISSLFSLTRNRITDPQAALEMEWFDTRLAQLGLIINAIGDFNVNRVPVGEFLDAIAKGLVRLHPQMPLTLDTASDPIVIRDNRAVAIGLLVGEIITLVRRGHSEPVAITVSLTRKSEQKLLLVFRVDGGIPPDSWRDYRERHFVEAIARQLRGELEVTQDRSALTLGIAFPYGVET